MYTFHLYFQGNMFAGVVYFIWTVAHYVLRKESSLWMVVCLLCAVVSVHVWDFHVLPGAVNVLFLQIHDDLISHTDGFNCYTSVKIKWKGGGIKQSLYWYISLSYIHKTIKFMWFTMSLQVCQYRLHLFPQLELELILLRQYKWAISLHQKPKWRFKMSYCRVVQVLGLQFAFEP